MKYQDPMTNEKYVPYCIEPSLGADRITLAILIDAYNEEELEDGTTRIVMKFHPAIAPIKIGVLPLTKKLSEKAEEVYTLLAKHFNVDFDERGSVGKRYRRYDESGTPYCVTIDFDTLEDQMVTIRDRDTMEQSRHSIDELVNIFREKLDY